MTANDRADAVASRVLSAACASCGAELTDLACIRSAAALLAEAGFDLFAGTVARLADTAGPSGNVPAALKPGAQRAAITAADNLARIGGAVS